MEIQLSEVGQGKWQAVLDGEVLVVSRQPFLDAARVLKAQGVSPLTPLVAIRPNGVVSLRSTVGAASELTVRENDRGGPSFQSWKPYAGPTPSVDGAIVEVGAGVTRPLVWVR
jgi:hypothetical protein